MCCDAEMILLDGMFLAVGRCVAASAQIRRGDRLLQSARFVLPVLWLRQRGRASCLPGARARRRCHGFCATNEVRLRMSAAADRMAYYASGGLAWLIRSTRSPVAREVPEQIAPSKPEPQARADARSMPCGRKYQRRPQVW